MTGTALLADALDATQSRSLREILAANRLLSLATVSPAGEAHVNTAFFAFTDGFDIILRSPVATEHARHIADNPSAAVAVFDSHQDHRLRRGAQLFGRLDEVSPDDGDAALECFRARFPDPAEQAGSYAELRHDHGSALYRFRALRVKIFDEALLAADGYVEIRA